MKTQIEKYAVAVNDEGVLRLFLWAKRSETGDFYVFLPRPHDRHINAHSSYHADGQFHVKSHDMSGRNKIMQRQSQKPDQFFSGTENLIDQTVTLNHVRSIGEICAQHKYTDCFVIDSSRLQQYGYIRVTADLVSYESGPNLVPNAHVLEQRKFRASPPFLAITLYEMPDVA